MKKVSLLLTLLLSLFIFACDGTTSDDTAGSVTPGGSEVTGPVVSPDDPAPVILTDDQNALYAASSLAVIDDSLNSIDFETVLGSANNLLKSDTAGSTSSFDWNDIFSSTGLDYSIPLGTVYEDEENGIKIDACLILGMTEGIGLGLIVTLDDYNMSTTEGVEETVSGQIAIGVTCEFGIEAIFTQSPTAIIISADTPLDNQLVFTGGALNGVKVGMVDVEMKYDMSSFSTGSPVSVAGTAIINNVSVPFDTKILELFMSFM